jgi:hypothetical protein
MESVQTHFGLPGHVPEETPIANILVHVHAHWQVHQLTIFLLTLNSKETGFLITS